MKYPFVSVVGILGAGKSTLTHRLADGLGYKAFAENIADNPFFDRYYNDPKRWTFHFQMSFFHRRLSQLYEIARVLEHSGAVQDSSIYEDCYTYGLSHLARGDLLPEERELYVQFVKTIEEAVPRPTLIVNLDVPTLVLQKRIALRGRASEQKANNEEYLSHLTGLHNAWLQEHEHIPQMRVPTDDMSHEFFEGERWKQFLGDVRRRLADEIKPLNA